MRPTITLVGLFAMVALAGCTGEDDLGTWRVTSVVHGSLTAPTDCPAPDEPVGEPSPDWLHRHAVLYMVLREEEFPWDHHMADKNEGFPEGGGVHMHGEDATLHWHGRCTTLADVLRQLDVRLSRDALEVGPSHGAWAGTYGDPIVGVNLWQQDRLVLVEDLEEYLGMYPHDGSRILITTPEMGERLLEVAEDYPGFKYEDRPKSEPTGGEE